MKFPLFRTALCLLACCLTGCLRVFQTLDVNPDRTARFSIQVEMDRKAMAGMLKAMAPNGEQVDVSKVLDISTPEARQQRLAEYISSMEGWSAISLADVNEPEPDKVVIRVKGYARDFSRLRLFHLQDLPGVSPQQLDFAPQLTVQQGGTWQMTRPSLASLFPAPPQKGATRPTDEEIEGQVTAITEVFPQRMKAAASLIGQIRCTTDLNFGGTLQTANGLRKTGAGTATWTLSMERVLQGLTDIASDRDLIRTALREARDAGREPAMPAAMLTRLNQAVYGNPDGVSLTVKPGDPVFDYAAEVAPLVTNPPPYLAGILKQAAEIRGQREKGGK